VIPLERLSWRRVGPAGWIGDQGYIGNGRLTPIRKSQFRGLLEWERKFSTEISRIRYLIERAIDSLTTWRVLHVDCRRPLSSLAETISGVPALEFRKTGRDHSL
jgi:hypothetical protein